LRHATNYAARYPEKTRLLVYQYAHQFPIHQKMLVTKQVIDWMLSK